VCLSVINFSNNKLNKLPLLLEQSELEELDISKNEICVIDNKDLFEVKMLKTLRLSENSLGMYYLSIKNRLRSSEDY
jgi:Leucine-rich repeat (LRR) protein